MNPLLALNQRDQFVWLDHISRSLITGGSTPAIDQRGWSRRGDQQPHYF